ncbi:MAG: AMP-binding protein [Ilumatobacteraceae bacterium]
MTAVTDRSPSYEINLAMVFEGVASRVPDRPAIVHRGRVTSFADLSDRVRRLARFLADRGLGCSRERSELAGHECGQSLMAQYLHNGTPYLEGLLGGFRARVAPFNVNYRYVVEELVELFADARPEAIQFDGRYAATLAAVLERIDTVPVLLQVDDGSGALLLDGAVDYEEALASVPADPGVVPSPDDLYVLYTGGTTGRPKGVLWRQGDAAVSALHLTNRRADREWASLDEQLDALGGKAGRMLASAPFMHGAAQWGVLQTLCEGNTVVIQSDVDRLDPVDIWDTVERERVSVLTIVGDAFGRPLLDEIEARPRDVASLRIITSGGAALVPANKQRFVDAIPGIRLIDGLGSSEAGALGRAHTSGEGSAAARVFEPSPGTVVLDEERCRVLEPGEDRAGWLATKGRVPLGYLRDVAKTAATFPIVDGIRFSVPGDRARPLADGTIEVLGRDSVTINTGGEKVFAEEVEAAVKHHPDVVDVIACGRPDERWGTAVVAVVSTRDGRTVTREEIVRACEPHLARYKLPKDVVVVADVKRNPNGKADYRWAAAIATGHTGDA